MEKTRGGKRRVDWVVRDEFSWVGRTDDNYGNRDYDDDSVPGDVRQRDL